MAKKKPTIEELQVWFDGLEEDEQTLLREYFGKKTPGTDPDIIGVITKLQEEMAGLRKLFEEGKGSNRGPSFLDTLFGKGE